MSIASRTFVLLLLGAFALAWFGTLGERRLTWPDEGRYAEIAREMVATGDWTTPRLNGYKYFEKPALQYWATATAFTLFGINEWTARLWTALTGFLGVLLVFHLGRRAFGPPVGVLSALVLGSSLLWVAIGHINTLDMGVSFFMSLAVAGLVLAELDNASRRERIAWIHVAWAAAALAVLSKGLIGIVLPVGAWGLYILIQRDWRRLGRMLGQWPFWTGVALFLALTVPWFVAVSLANDEFFQFFFIHEHVERFLTKVHDRYEPPWYFLPYLALGVSPWLVALFPALAKAWRAAPERAFQPARFLLVWAVMVFVFFSASSSKMASYILPIFPALAVLVARYLTDAGPRLLMAQSIAYALFGIGLALAAYPGAMSEASPTLPAELVLGYVPWIVGAGVVLALGAIASIVLARRKSTMASVAVLAGGALAAWLALGLGYDALSPAYSAHGVMQKVRPLVKPDVPFYTVETFDHTVPFYLGRTVTMVVYRDELGQSIEWERRDFISDIESFARAWNADREAWAIFPPGDLPRLRDQMRLPMEVVATDPRRVIVRKP